MQLSSWHFNMQQVVARTKVNPKDIGDIQIGALLENRLLDPLHNLETPTLLLHCLDIFINRTNKHVNR